jgi:hypothetical protein
MDQPNGEMGSSNGRVRSRARRAARPCDACRKRKSRCFTKPESSVCALCELRETAYTYLERPVQRKPPAAAELVSHEELALITVEAETVTTPGSVPDKNTYISPAGASGGLLYTRSGLKISENSIHQHGARHSLPVALLDNSLGSEPHRFAELYGLTSNMEPILVVSYLGFS